MTSKLIAVLGATGNQGGSVADVFLKSPGWNVRAITRNPLSDKAYALSVKGAQVVQANLDSLESLEKAFQGAHVIFAVSDFWGLYGDPANKDKPNPGQPLNVWAAEHETQQLRNVVDAAANVSTLDRFIISSLSNATKWSKGKYTHVYHFDSKAAATEYAKNTYSDLWKKTSVFQAGFFLTNFLGDPIMTPKKTTDNTIRFMTLIDGDLKLPIIAPDEDSGPLVKALVEDEPGKNLIGYRTWATMKELAQALSKVTGLKAEVVTLPKSEPPVGVPPELAQELSDNFLYWNEFGFEGRDDPTIVHPTALASPPSLESIEAYLRKQDWSKILH
ncbi:unnamed protein product [Clonostachys byssicola]|uniref:NmrA-like domain-containing protein n=1 Tax=Clonostachys byssicola TaxID=160290 RepID=A0A9N9UVD1_9HYPO|nr:unnamed protein product [Clonostachys byssicola]